MDLKKFLLVTIFVASIASDNLAFKDTLVEQVIQLSVLVLLGLLLAYCVFRENQKLLPLIDDRLFHLFMVLCFVVSAFVHDFSSQALLRIGQYWISGTMIFVSLPRLFYENYSFFRYFLNCVFILSLFLATLGVVGSLAPLGMFGSVLSQKPAYTVLGLVSSGGILEHPITLSCQVMVALLIGSYLWLESKKSFYLIGCAILLAGLICSMGRTGILGVTVGGIYGLTYYKWKRSGITVFAISAILIPLSVFTSYLIVSQIDILREFRVEYGLANREHLWRLSLELIKEKPLFGYGMRAAQEDLAYYFMVGDFGTKQEIGGAGNHNAFLDMAFNFGVPLMLVYYSLFFRSIFNGYFSKSNPKIKFLIIGVGTSTLLCSHFIIFNIGGVRFTSICLIALLGFGREFGIFKEMKLRQSVV